MNFEKQNEQFQQIDSKFNQVSTLYEIHSLRLHAMIAYFDKIRTLYARFIKKNSNINKKTMFGKLISEVPDHFIAPGNPGFQVDRVGFFLDVIRSLSVELDYTVEHLQNSSINPLMVAVQERENLFKDLTAKYNDALQKRQKAQKNYESSKAVLNTVINKLGHAVESPQTSKFSLLKKPKTKSDIALLIKSYRECMRNNENNLYALNGAHLNYVNVAIEVINTFTGSAVNRYIVSNTALYQVWHIFENAVKVLDNISTNGLNLHEDNQIWQIDFMRFVQNVGIMRLPCRSVTFKPFNFSFADSKFEYNILKPQLDYNAPIAIARVLKDFSPQGKSTNTIQNPPESNEIANEENDYNNESSQAAPSQDDPHKQTESQQEENHSNENETQQEETKATEENHKESQAMEDENNKIHPEGTNENETQQEQIEGGGNENQPKEEYQIEEPPSHEPSEQHYHENQNKKSTNLMKFSIGPKRDNSLKVPKEGFTQYLSVKEGEYVYIYNSLRQDWTICSHDIHSELAYVPSSYLEIENNPGFIGLALVKSSQIPLNDDYLLIKPGELLIVLKNDDNDTVSCRNISGKTGIVSKENVVLDNYK